MALHMTDNPSTTQLNLQICPLMAVILNSEFLLTISTSVEDKSLRAAVSLPTLASPSSKDLASLKSFLVPRAKVKKHFKQPLFCHVHWFHSEMEDRVTSIRISWNKAFAEFYRHAVL